jgi:uncharacterized membrane protein YraQ (UPF0718 family)
MGLNWGLIIIWVVVSLVIGLIVSFLYFLYRTAMDRIKVQKQWRENKGVMEIKNNPNEIIERQVSKEVNKEPIKEKFSLFKKKEIKKEPVIKSNEEIIKSMIIQYRNAGYSKEIIKNLLLDKKYTEEFADKVLSEVL